MLLALLPLALLLLLLAVVFPPPPPRFSDNNREQKEEGFVVVVATTIIILLIFLFLFFFFFVVVVVVVLAVRRSFEVKNFKLFNKRDPTRERRIGERARRRKYSTYFKGKRNEPMQKQKPKVDDNKNTE